MKKEKTNKNDELKLEYDLEGSKSQKATRDGRVLAKLCVWNQMWLRCFQTQRQ